MLPISMFVCCVAALSPGGEARFRQLPLQSLKVDSDSQILD
ncbi:MULTISPECIES: hypothetical protein [unclassified Nodularia (in: cyanobacteria)]|nr:MULTISPECIES: hypothetical protein [unclassified Nodularia (in: cyanobacteria)]